jgi:hypothetical protein
MRVSREGVRYLAAGAALLMATLYALIGFGVLDVGGTTQASASEAPDMWVFGVSAATAFLISAIVFLTVDRRWVWVAAIVFNVLVFAMYIAVSAMRAPAFEVWGMALRLIQFVLIGALGYLALHGAEKRVAC